MDYSDYDWTRQSVIFTAGVIDTFWLLLWNSEYSANHIHWLFVPSSSDLYSTSWSSPPHQMSRLFDLLFQVWAFSFKEQPIRCISSKYCSFALPPGCWQPVELTEIQGWQYEENSLNYRSVWRGLTAGTEGKGQLLFHRFRVLKLRGESRERGVESGAFGRRRTAQLVCVLKLETEKAVHW